MMTKDLSDKIIAGLQKYYRNVSPNLRYANLYELAVAVVLSAQTTDRQVNSVTGALFRKYPDFKTLAQARLADVRTMIRSTGFYRNKSKNIVNLAKQVMERFSGRLPDVREELVTLPGIGRKSANVILAMGFGKPALAVDTHVLRVAYRLAYTDLKKPLAVEKALMSFIPEKKWKLAHLLFIEHGRSLCRARKPLCHQCPINAYCDSPDKIR
ncbi:MAG: endonuclease III [Spirochaetes bacterium RBG_16_49_21]|nr:MAG: endonuclease III [Spirochaetes bacterium RBG_16_49_21]